MKHEEFPLNRALLFLVLQVALSMAAIVFLVPRMSAKILIVFFLAEGGAALIFGKHIRQQPAAQVSRILAVFILLSTLLTCTYYMNIMGDTDLDFAGFQADSENLVDGAIASMQAGIMPEDCGLGLFDAQTQTMDSYSGSAGLQGYFFGMLGRNMRFSQIKNVGHLLCAYSAAVVFTLIAMLLSRKYDLLMAGCFFVTFWLSAWIVNFARNLFWVEAAWFAPMGFGLFFSLFRHRRWCRMVSYIGVFFSIFLKCLCGYEYITCIMMGMIAFPLFDLCRSVLRRDRKDARMLLKQTVLLGILALLGFCGALLAHSYLRGEGDILRGLMLTYQRDVLRRVSANADPAMFGDDFSASLQASLFAVLEKYLRFSTDIILGLDGKLFPLLAMLPVVFFVYQYIRNTLDWNDVVMYLVLLFTSTSWFILAKPHSYIHTHMNFVLWYFGFVQICFYLICKYTLRWLRERNRL